MNEGSTLGWWLPAVLLAAVLGLAVLVVRRLMATQTHLQRRLDALEQQQRQQNPVREQPVVPAPATVVAAVPQAATSALPAAGPHADAPAAAAPSAATDTGAAVAPELAAAIVVATLTHRALKRGEAAAPARSHRPGSQLYASRWVANGRARQTQAWHRRSR